MSYIEAVFTIHTTFQIPDGIDLKNKEQVKEYYIARDGTFIIELTNGEELEIEMDFEPQLNDYEEDLKCLRIVNENGEVEQI